MFDVLILVAKKDFNKLKFVCDSIIKNVEGALSANFYIISPVAIPDEYQYLDAHYLIDHDVLDLNFSKIDMEDRQGWYRQQFIKLFQEETSDNYLVVDADIWINQSVKINENSPTFFLGRDQYHLPYFELIKDITGIDKIYPHSFISEMMYFKRDVIKHMLHSLGMNKHQFFAACVKKINEMGDASGFSEYELYGNYVSKNWPYAYQYETIKVLHDRKKRMWTDEELQSHINKHISSEYDILTMHSWM